MNDPKPYILFIEDEKNLAEIVKESLETRQFRVTHHINFTDGLIAYSADKPDLLIVDVMLPDGDGFELARNIRRLDSYTPIIFLTSKSLPQDVVQGFESGGNDYLRKPFSLEELVVRIKSLLSKNGNLFTGPIPIADNMQIGQYIFHHGMAKLTIDTEIISLTAREADILLILFRYKNLPVERKLLLTKIWGNNDFFSGRSLDVFITKLRKYLKRDPTVAIMNIRGIGYKLVSS